ncbi:TPA: MFS transporter [Staphylococcus delphini]|nr:MFS transporter [Staphylococcus delphini]
MKDKRNIIYLVGSKSVSRIGDIMFDFANNTFLASLNPTSLSLVAVYQLLESVVGILFNLFGGVLADSLKRKKIIISTNILCGVTCVILSFVYNKHWLIYAILITNVILAFMNTLSGPSYKAFTKEIVKKEHISQLNSLLETTSTIIKITIPAVAVLLYNWIGVHGVLLIDGLSFLIAASLVYFIVPVNEEVKEHKSLTIRGGIDDLKMGFIYIYSHKNIFIIITLSAFVNFFLSAYNLLLPYSSQMFENVSVGLYGTFLTAEAIGGFVGSIASGLVNKRLSNLSLMIFLSLSGMMLMLATPLYFTFRNTIILAFSPALFSLFLSVFNIQFFSIVQRDVDNDYLGRVFGIIFTVAIIFMPIGTVIFSIVLDPRNSFNFLIIGIFVSLLSLVFGILLIKYNAR